MKLHAVVLVRNEADIWPSFIRYHADLFDNILVVDHQSTDGTLEITQSAIAHGVPIELLRYCYRGYFQSEISVAMARRCFEADADWVFFLDADEFLSVPDRAALEGLLRNSASDVVTFSWQNLIPTHFGTFDSFDLAQTFRFNGQTSRYGKVAIGASYAAQNPKFCVQTGNHTVRAERAVTEFAPAPSIGTIFHIPIRSMDRLRHKLSSGTAAYRAMPKSDAATGFHWFQLSEQIARGALTPELLNGIIANYGEPFEQLHPTTTDKPGWGDVIIASGDQFKKPDYPPASQNDFAQREADLCWRTFHFLPNAPITVRARDNELHPQPLPLRPDGRFGPEVFGALVPSNGEMPWLPQAIGPLDLLDALVEMLEPIRTFVLSVWAGHSPLLRAVVTVLRPRRFVELGTHFGQSFLSACQTIERAHIASECVAIDTWTGDEQAGFYDEGVLADFTYRLMTMYPGTSYYIRSLFDDANHCFADGSIDLLHVDGLHTFEAVTNDFCNWLPKMSDRGVVLFHDTTVYEGDFGVWQFWEEVKQKYPSFNVFHSHGLGILYVGAEPSPAAELLRSLSANERIGAFVNDLLRRQGAEAVSHAEAALRAEMVAAENQKLAAELKAAKRRPKAIRKIGRFLKRMQTNSLEPRDPGSENKPCPVYRQPLSHSSPKAPIARRFASAPFSPRACSPVHAFCRG